MVSKLTPKLLVGNTRYAPFNLLMVHYSKSETRNCIASIDDAKLEAVVLCIESSFPNLSDHSGGWVGIFPASSWQFSNRGLWMAA